VENIDRVISECLAHKRVLALGASILFVFSLVVCVFGAAGPWVLLIPLFCLIGLLLADDEASIEDIRACRSMLLSSEKGRFHISDLEAVFEAQSGRMLKSQVNAFYDLCSKCDRGSSSICSSDSGGGSCGGGSCGGGD